METDQRRMAHAQSREERKGVTAVEGNFTFEIVKGEKIIVSDSQESPVKNQIEIKVTYDLDEEPDIMEIDYVFSVGTGALNFAEYQNLKQIEFKVDGWTVPELSMEKFRNLKKGIKEKDIGNAAWYACRYEKDGEFIYALIPGTEWSMKDHLIMELCMENVVTTAVEGTSVIGCSVEDNMASSRDYKVEIIKEQDHSVKILDFYPESGSAVPGEKIQLKWAAENAQKLFLYSGEQKQELAAGQESILVTVQDTTEFRLEAVNQEKKDSRNTTVQILPLFIKEFSVDYEEKKVKWDVCCGKNIKINQKSTQFASSSWDLSDFNAGSPIILTAEGKNTTAESAVYYGTEDESTDVKHFQKTITFYKGFQILDVSWELFQVTRVNVPKSIRIVYQDRERNQLYDIRGGGTLGIKGNWQQILTGTEPSRAGENILMTMYVEGYGDHASRKYEITI